ncbi:MAG: hypothetical protein M3Y87_34205 [Myxococcota bacterium]|nr:hypothetical protein [Myxococcota bacterium]
MRRSIDPGRVLVVVLALVALSGCDCAGEPGATGTSATADRPAGDTGFIEGIVRLADGAEIPQYPENPLQAAGRSPIPDDCTPPREADRTPVTVADETGGLIGLSIVGTGAEEGNWPRAEEPVVHEVVIRDCRITPSILVATRGDRVRISNETAYPFFPEIGEGILQALLRGEPREVPLERGGVRTIQCGFAAPCGRMELITLYHPIHTVSGPEGRFRLEVPAEQDVRITAWHPLFQETATTTRVGAGETREVELTIRPGGLRLPDSPEGGGDVPAEDVPAGDVPAGDVPADDVPAGDVPADDVPAGDVPADVAPDPNVPF